jgi:hypothetical protein
MLGSATLGLACSAVAASDVAAERGAIVWRLAGDGDWLVGLPADSTAAPAPLRENLLSPSYLDGRPVRTHADKPALVLRLDGNGAAGAPAAAACALPGWLSADAAGACLGTSSDDRPVALAANLGWVGANYSFGVETSRANIPMMAGASSLMLAPQAAASSTEWPLMLAAPGKARLAVERLGLDGRIRLGESLGLDWSAVSTDARRTGYPAVGDLGFEQKALSLGLSAGPWSGGVTGRVTRPRAVVGVESPYESLDFEVTWLTPWDAELRFGAENLLMRGGDRQPVQPQARISEPPSRTPFVRYRQDF